jgi:hypothetical protein
LIRIEQPRDKSLSELTSINCYLHSKAVDLEINPMRSHVTGSRSFVRPAAFGNRLDGRSHISQIRGQAGAAQLKVGLPQPLILPLVME